MAPELRLLPLATNSCPRRPQRTDNSRAWGAQRDLAAVEIDQLECFMIDDGRRSRPTPNARTSATMLGLSVPIRAIHKMVKPVGFHHAQHVHPARQAKCQIHRLRSDEQ